MDIKSKNKMPLCRRKGKKRSVCERPVVEAGDVLENNSDSDSELEANQPGPVFTKGLRLSQVLGLNVVLKLRLLSQLSFVLKPYSQRVT